MDNVRKDAVSLAYANSIIATLREAFLVLGKDLQVLSANQAFYSLFGVTEKDTLGIRFAELGNKSWDIPALLQLLKEVEQEDKVVNDYEVVCKFERIGERAMRLNARQFRVPENTAFIVTAEAGTGGGGGKGTESLVLLAIEDITERKRLQMALKDSEERFRMAFETSNNILLLIHKTEGTVLNANAAAQAMLGYSPEEILKTKVWEIGMVKDYDDFLGMVSRLELDGAVHYDDTPVRTKKGLSISCDVLMLDRAKVIQCDIRDITARKKKEGEARDRLRELRIFYDASVGREERIIQLKKEIELLREGQEPPG